MISKISTAFTQKLISHGAIQIDEFDLYVYALFILITHIIFCTLTLILGLMLNIFLESVIFHFSFSLIRKYAGGYHAKTELKCELSSIFLIVSCLSIIKFLSLYDYKLALPIFTALAVVFIFVLSPLDTQEKPLSKKEFQYFRKISRLILLAYSTVIIITFAFSCQSIYIPICISLVIESLLLIAGKLKAYTRAI